MHRGQDVALERVRRGQPLGLRQGVVGEFGRAAHVGKLIVALDQAERGDEVGRILQRAELVERPLDPEPVCRGQALGVALDADQGASTAVPGDHIAERASRVRAGFVDPDADVLDDRGVLRLSQVRRAGEQGHPPVAAEPEALEEAEPEGVVAGQVVHALLLEEQDAEEAAPLQRADHRIASLVELVPREVDRHAPPPSAPELLLRRTIGRHGEGVNRDGASALRGTRLERPALVELAYRETVRSRSMRV